MAVFSDKPIGCMLGVSITVKQQIASSLFPVQSFMLDSSVHLYRGQGWRGGELEKICDEYAVYH